METNRIQNGIKLGLSVGLAASILGVFYLNNARKDLQEELSAERVQIQNTIEAKELVNKKLLAAYSDLEDYKLENNIIKNNLSEKEAKINQLNAEAQDARRIKQRNNKLESDVKKLNTEIQKLKQELISAENSHSSNQLALQQKISKLENELLALQSQLRENTKIVANYFRIEALKGKKDKLTRKAKRTHRLLVSFDASKEMMSAIEGGNLYLSISGPGVQKLTAANSEKVTIQLGDKRIEIPVVAKTKLQNMKQGRQEILMTTNTKLQPGIYQADVYTENNHLGGAQIRLN